MLRSEVDLNSRYRCSEARAFHDFPGEMWFLELLSTLGSRSALSNAIWVVQLA